MTRQLTTMEVMRLGRAHETRRYWQQLRTFIISLYGERARYITQTMLTTPTGNPSNPFMRGGQFIVTDAQREVLPFDLATTWWQGRNLSADDSTNVMTSALDDMLGASLPLPLRTDLRAYAEECLGNLFQIVREAQPPLVNTYDLATTPPLPFEGVMLDTADGRRELREDEAISAGKEYAQLDTWERRRNYVHMLYGAQATRMLLTRSWQDSDDNYDETPSFDNSYNETPSFKIYDTKKQQLFYDFSLPWWSRFNFTPEAIAAYRKRHALNIKYNDLNREDHDELITTSIGNALNMLRRDLLDFAFGEVWEWMRPATAKYDLASPPALRYPVLSCAEASA